MAAGPTDRRRALTPHYHPPVKRSLAIHGHRTSISLEPFFWSLLKEAAKRAGISVAQLVARIDGERIKAVRPPGLAGAIRLWLAADIEAQGKGTVRPALAPLRKNAPDNQ